MKRTALACVVALATIACVSPRSGRGLRLPDGSVERGRTAFVEMKCYGCHSVSGVELPAPFAEPPTGVVLGGAVSYPRTDGELITAITNPSHSLVRPAEGSVQSGRGSRMGDFGDVMRVRQLVDIVAFLQSRYVVESAQLPPH